MKTCSFNYTLFFAYCIPAIVSTTKNTRLERIVHIIEKKDKFNYIESSDYIIKKSKVNIICYFKIPNYQFLFYILTCADKL